MKDKSRNIILIGMMGTGKSTVGKQLADRLGWPYVDTDAWIEEHQGTSISSIFAEQGEAYFRQVETEALEAVLGQEHQVFATGGGAVLAAKNRELMLSSGLVIALTATEEAIIERVSRDKNRPLLQGDTENRVRTVMQQRLTAYDFADLKLDTTSRSIQELTDEIIAYYSEMTSS